MILRKLRAASHGAWCRSARVLLAGCTDFLDNYSRLRRSEAIIIADSFRNYKFLGDLPRCDAQRKMVGALEPKGRSSRRRERERERERETEREDWDEEGTIGVVVLYVETLIGVTCSETSYRRVALIFRGSYMPVEGENGQEEREKGGSMCGGWYTLDAAVDAPDSRRIPRR